MNSLDSPRTFYTVSQLNGTARLVLSTHFGTLWVEGEISNLSRPSSGHLYFTLKDAEAQVRCALFRGSARGLGFRPENGSRVLAQAQVSLYEPRGDFQLIVEYLEESGDGALRRAFEALKQRLAAEGLFDAARKQPIPRLPGRVGVITSASGAALRDILSVLARRFPALPICLLPVRVQGVEAAGEIARAIELADRHGDCDVLILARGGGSLEDLWAFNEEVVARAMAACFTPIVTGVGHETDFTIADLVADLRAPTPSAAAEAVSPDRQEWLHRLQMLHQRLTRRALTRLQQNHVRLENLDRRLALTHPSRRLHSHAQRLDELEARLRRAMATQIARCQARLAQRHSALLRLHPGQRLQTLEFQRQQLRGRLLNRMQQQLAQHRQTCTLLVEKLHGISPLATLSRGYAIAKNSRSGKILRKADEIQPGEVLETWLAEGRIHSRVESTESLPLPAPSLKNS